MSTQPTALAEIIAYYNQYGVLPGSPQAAPQAYSYTTDPLQFVATPVAPSQMAPVVWTGPASFQVPGAPAAQVPASGTAPLTIVAAAPSVATPAASAPSTSGGAAVTLASVSVPVPALHAQFISSGGGGGGGIGGVIGAIGSTALDYIPIIGPILGALFGSLFGGTDLSQITKQLNQLAQQLGQLGDTLTRFAWSIGFALGELARAIAEVWDNFLDALWSAVKSLWKALWCVVSSVLPKIIQILKNMRQYLDWIYQHLIRPIMNYLQKVRRILQILKLLHVPFAAKLDTILGQIQSAVFGPFYWLLRWFNSYGSWINTLLAWDLTIQRPIFLRTMQKYQGDWIGMWWNAQAANLPAGGGLPAAPPGAPKTPAQDQADFQQYVNTGAGPFADVVAQARNLYAQVDAQL